MKGTLRAARDSFSELVAYFGENAAAFASDGDFWRDVTAFVHALSRAQREILQQQLVCSSDTADISKLSFRVKQNNFLIFCRASQSSQDCILDAPFRILQCCL